MPRALKVYRTPIGFHDAYVAATSQAAALKAWGTDRDLFARGAAEVVTDPDLTAAPLANPGKIVRVLRGSADEQMAAAAPVARAPRAKPKEKPRKPPPRPSRAALDKAEHALEAARAAQGAEVDALNRRIAALERERRALQQKQESALEKLRTARDNAEAAHEAALESWRRDLT